MPEFNQLRVWNFDLPPYPREGVFHLDSSEHCQVTRFLKFEAGELARLHQLDVISNALELKRFKRKLRKELQAKLGVEYDPDLPLDIREFGKVEKPDFTITKLIYQSRPGIYVTGLLYVPRGKGPFPAVLQMHGHNIDGKFGINPQSVSLTLVKSGFVCLTIDAIGTYERANTPYQVENHGSIQAGFLLNTGEALLGSQLVDNRRGVDVLSSLPCVDRRRIGATGASGGGNQTMYLAAFDERIAAAMPVVSVGSFESYVYGVNCMCELIPDGLTITGEAGVLALIAPRPLCIANALYDCNFDFRAEEMLKTYHAVEKVYWNLGKGENLSYSIADRPHSYTDRQREAALGFFTCFLKGEGHGRPQKLPVIELLPEAELRLFDPPASRPPEVATLGDLTRRRSDLLHQKLLETAHFSAVAKRKELQKLLRLEMPAGNGELQRFAPVDGTGRFAIRFGHHLLPFLLREGKKSGKFVIVLHPEGKAAIDAPTLQKAAQSGATLVLPDLFGSGETAQANHTTGLYHQFFRQLLWVGKSLMGEWVSDVLMLQKVLKNRFGAQEIEVIGLRECGLTAVCANALKPGFAAVTLADAPASLRYDLRSVDLKKPNFKEKFHTGAIYSLAGAIPDFLLWGDVSLAAALGFGEVKFTAPRTSDGTPLSKSEFAQIQAEIAQLGAKVQ